MIDGRQLQEIKHHPKACSYALVRNEISSPPFKHHRSPVMHNLVKILKY